MGLFTLIELCLVLFTFYAIFKLEGGMRILVSVLCLVAVFSCTIFFWEQKKTGAT
jgi:uncharacterized membrane protein